MPALESDIETLIDVLILRSSETESAVSTASKTLLLANTGDAKSSNKSKISSEYCWKLSKESKAAMQPVRMNVPCGRSDPSIGILKKI